MKFEWKGLTFIVSEMSRAQALRFTDDVTTRFKGEDGLIHLTARQYDPLLVSYTPLIIQQNGMIHAKGKRAFTTTDGDELMLTLPLTEDGFNDLPKSLSDTLAEAAQTANFWIDGDAKNAVRRTTETSSEPQSAKPLSEA